MRNEFFFPVTSSYKVLEEGLLLDGGITTLEEGVFEYLWKSLAASKVIAFSWTILLGCIPTKVNLVFVLF